MTTNIKMQLEFVSAGSESKSFTDSVRHDRDATDQGKENLAREMFAELRKAVSFANNWHALPDVDDLLNSSSSKYVRTDPMSVQDIFNIPALWLEISNTFRDLRYVLAQSKAYKDLEPPNTTPITDALCAHLHFEKMYKLNLAVFQLVKIQDLVVRLLQEGFSGKLISVDYDDEDWEQKLTLKDARKGLTTLKQNGEITEEEYQAIVIALAHPSKSPHQNAVLNYRNRLTHRITPSVDYRQLYTHLQDRAGKVTKDATGAVMSRAYLIGTGGIVPEFTFNDLYTALADYMSHVADMLKALKLIPRLSS